MRIAFINPNSHSEYPRPPLGLLSVATVCQSAGHEVKIVDADLLNLMPKQVINKIDDFPVIGITALTPTIHEAADIARRLPDKTVILGGVHASVFPKECAELGYFRTVVVGEGEGVILDILKDFELGNLRSIYSSNPVPLPLPDYSLLDLPKYKARYPHMVLTPWTIASTSRGCPFECTFCFKGVSGKHFNAMPAEQMLELVTDLQVQHGIQDITFYDDLFTLDKKRVQKFCTGIIKAGIKLTWTCESRVNSADLDTLCLMRKAGCRLIYYGIESGNQRILDTLNKQVKLWQVTAGVNLTHDAGISAAGYFMLGCPGETEQMIRETVEFARQLGLDHAQFSVCSPLPGSKLYQQYVSVGYPVPDWSAFRYLGGNGDSPMFTSSELSRQYLEQSVKEANEGFIGKVNK